MSDRVVAAAGIIRDAVTEHLRVGGTVKDWAEYEAPARLVAVAVAELFADSTPVDTVDLDATKADLVIALDRLHALGGEHQVIIEQLRALGEHNQSVIRFANRLLRHRGLYDPPVRKQQIDVGQ